MVIHKYSEEERKFFNEFAPGHTYKEIMKAYNERFEDQITESRVKAYMGNNGINNGLTGRFKKGHIPFNKGAKGQCGKGCEKTWFKPGHLPKNTKAIGYERINKDGYIEVKTKMRPSNFQKKDNFILKHRLVWEEANGPVPKGYKITFLDGDKTNFDLSNLALVSNAEHLEITRENLRSEDPKLTETGILIAKAGLLVRKKKKACREPKSRTSK